MLERVFKLRENNTGIATGRQQNCPGQGLHIGAYSGVFSVNGVQTAAQRHHHIGSGISVRHGKHIQIIDSFLVFLQVALTAYHHLMELRSIHFHLHITQFLQL